MAVLTSGMPLTLREASGHVTAALLACSQPRLDAALIAVTQALGPEVAESLARAAMNVLPPDVRAWWLEPCDLCSEQVPGHTHN